MPADFAVSIKIQKGRLKTFQTAFVWEDNKV